jgi:DNA invertase Pin-like site-specific DNA recombinase
MSTDNGKRAMIYCRVSTGHQGGISFEVQAEAVTAYCVARGLIPMAVVHETFSGTRIHREKLEVVVLPAVRSRSIDYLVVYDQDRWFRDEFGRLKLEHEVFRPNGVEVLITTEPDFANAEDRQFYRGMQGLLAQKVAAETRRKIIDAMACKAQRAEYMGGSVPYGYETEIIGHRTNQRGKQKPIKTLVPNDAEARVVRFILELYGRGRSAEFPIPEAFSGFTDLGSDRITQILNAVGLRQRSGKPWSTFSVKKLIRDEHDHHLGTFSYNKGYGSTSRVREHADGRRPEEDRIVVEGAYPPIVSRELHDRCRQKLAMNSRKRGGGKAKRSPYLGSGIFRDKACGTPLVGRTSSAWKRRPVRQRYMCSDRYNKRGCSTPMVPSQHLDKLLELVVTEFFSDPKIRQAAIATATKRIEQQPDQLKSVQAELRIAHRKLDNLKANLLQAPDVAVVMQDELMRLHRQVERLEATVSHLQASQAPESRARTLQRLEDLADNFLDVFRAADTQQKNLLLKTLIQKAEVDVPKKLVHFELAFPLELRGSGEGKSDPTSAVGCIETLAEVHGNRTRQALALAKAS